jgi:hypothetical protein
MGDLQALMLALMVKESVCEREMSCFLEMVNLTVGEEGRLYSIHKNLTIRQFLGLLV